MALLSTPCISLCPGYDVHDLVMLPRAAASAERINEVLEKDPRITDQRPQ